VGPQALAEIGYQLSTSFYCFLRLESSGRTSQ
jgi:hypothetical protein